MPELGLPASLSNNIKKKKTWSTLSSLAQQKKKASNPCILHHSTNAWFVFSWESLERAGRQTNVQLFQVSFVLLSSLCLES